MSDVVELLVGRESAVFKRRKDKDKDDNEHLSLSLVTKGALPAPPSADGEDEPDPTGGRETLDVSFDSDENFGLWLAALKYLLTRNQQADLSKKKTNDLASDLFGTRPSSSYAPPLPFTAPPPANAQTAPAAAILAAAAKFTPTPPAGPKPPPKPPPPKPPPPPPPAAPTPPADDPFARAFSFASREVELARGGTSTGGSNGEKMVLEPASVAKYVNMFEMAQAEAGNVLSLAKEQAGLVKSGLDVETLMHIWSLSDTDKDDRLNLKEYLICCSCDALREASAAAASSAAK